MLELQLAVKDRLSSDNLLGSMLFYFVAPLNERPPYVEYWTGNGTRDEAAGFNEDGREYDIFVQASSRVGLQASELYGRAERLLNYAKLDVSGWTQRGKVTWLHELDDPADTTQDDELIYYAGGVFRIALYRQRTDRG